MTSIGLFETISFQEPSSFFQRGVNFMENLWNFGGRKVEILTTADAQKGFYRQGEAPSLLITAIKIALFFTLLVPLLVLLEKAALRITLSVSLSFDKEEVDKIVSAYSMKNTCYFEELSQEEITYLFQLYDAFPSDDFAREIYYLLSVSPTEAQYTFILKKIEERATINNSKNLNMPKETGKERYLFCKDRRTFYQTHQIQNTTLIKLSTTPSDVERELVDKINRLLQKEVNEDSERLEAHRTLLFKALTPSSSELDQDTVLTHFFISGVESKVEFVQDESISNWYGIKVKSGVIETLENIMTNESELVKALKRLKSDKQIFDYKLLCHLAEVRVYA